MNSIRNNLVLELHIPDFAKARSFYAMLGFEEIQYDPTSGGGSDLGYLVLAREDPLGRVLLNFYGDREEVVNHAHFKDFPPTTPRGYAVEITIPVADLDGLWQRIQGTVAVARVDQSLVTKRWGKRDFRLVDPFGFYLRFTELVDWGQ